MLGFGIYGFIFDGVCEIGDGKVIDMVICVMKEKKFVLDDLLLGYDIVIRKFCDLGKMYVVELLFKRVRDEKVLLKDVIFGCMLRVFCKGDRVDEVIRLYYIILNEKIAGKKSYC